MESGLLAGAGFAVLYALMTLPMGVIGDRKSRTMLAAIGIALWSIFTTLCGLSRNFIQLLLCRIGVGVGEATLTPSSYPIIKSLFSSASLSTAIGIYSSGIYIGSGLAYWLGGLTLLFIRTHHLLQHLSFVKFDWQIVFFLFGIPGMILSLLMLAIQTPESEGTANKFNLSAFKTFLREHHYRFLKLTIASALFNVAVYAAGVWLPTYLQRVQHMDVGASGRVLGAAMIFIAPVGAIAGGMIGDRLNLSRGIRGRITVIISAIAAIMICFLLLAIRLPEAMFLIPLLLLSLLLSMPVAITAAMIQEISPEGMRSTAPAFMLMMQNLIGMSLGPSLVAVLTQYAFHDDMCIGMSISIVGTMFCILSMILFYHTQKQIQ
jgi:MFS family permease